jgi:hypothetical protein
MVLRELVQSVTMPTSKFVMKDPKKAIAQNSTEIKFQANKIELAKGKIRKKHIKPMINSSLDIKFSSTNMIVYWSIYNFCPIHFL